MKNRIPSKKVEKQKTVKTARYAPQPEHISVRIAAATAKKVTAAAKSSGRSLAGEIEHRLQNSFFQRVTLCEFCARDRITLARMREGLTLFMNSSLEDLHLILKSAREFKSAGPQEWTKSRGARV